MIVLMSVFKVLMPMVYLVVWGTYLWLFYTDHPTARRLCTRFGIFGRPAAHRLHGGQRTVAWPFAHGNPV